MPKNSPGSSYFGKIKQSFLNLKRETCYRIIIALAFSLLFFAFGSYYSDIFCTEIIENNGFVRALSGKEQNLSLNEVSPPPDPNTQNSQIIGGSDEDASSLRSGFENGRRDCYKHCKKQFGYCPEFCGNGKCCRKDFAQGNGCGGKDGCGFKHCCVPLEANDLRAFGVVKKEFILKQDEENKIKDSKKVKRSDGNMPKCKEATCLYHQKRVDVDGTYCRTECQDIDPNDPACTKLECQEGETMYDTNDDGCFDYCHVDLLNIKLFFTEKGHQTEDYEAVSSDYVNGDIKIKFVGFTDFIYNDAVSVSAGWYGRYKTLMQSGVACRDSCEAKVQIFGLSPNTEYRFKTWHHNTFRREARFDLWWKGHETHTLKHTVKTKHCNKITQHIESVRSDSEGNLELNLKTNAETTSNEVLLNLNALEILEFCEIDSECLPNYICRNKYCIRDLRRHFEKRTPESPRNRIAIMGMWLGWEWPMYLNATFHSFSKNSDIMDFYILTNMTTPHFVPSDSNIELLNVNPLDFYERFAYITDDETRALRDFPGKFVNDLKHMFPLLFPEIFEGYEYWGWIDLDLVLGDIKSWIHLEKDTHVQSFAEGYYKTVHLRGQLSIFQNIPQINNKWSGKECEHHLLMELQNMYRKAYKKPMHKNDEGCFSYALFNDPAINVKLWPNQIHDHHVRSIHYHRGKLFACNKELLKCKSLMRKLYSNKEFQNNCEPPKFLLEDKAITTYHPVTYETKGSHRRCMTWIPQAFKSCINVSDTVLPVSNYYKNDFLVSSTNGNMSNIGVTPGHFKECISDGDSIREVMLHHWKILKPDVIDESIFQKLDDTEVYVVFKHGQEIYKFEN